MNLTYLRYELIRSVRNKRVRSSSRSVFPLCCSTSMAGANRHIKLGGIPFPTYYLAGMASFGTMMAMISSRRRIAGRAASRLEPSVEAHADEHACVHAGEGSHRRT